MNSFFQDTWVQFVANVRMTLRNIVWLIVGMFQPVCYLLLFAPLLDNIASVPGFPDGGTYNVFTPGLIIMIAIFGAGLAGFTMVFNLRFGVVDRLRVTPVNRLSILLSMVLKDVLTLLVQCTILVAIALLLGLKPDWAGMLLFIPLIALIGITMASFSYALALLVKDEGALASSVNLISVPLLLLSGITLPLTLAPTIIQNIGKANPFAYAVDAARALIAGNLGASPIIWAYIIFAVLAALTLYWATTSLQKVTA